MNKQHPKSKGGVGEGRIGIPQLAKLARVSIGTVDRALHARKGVSEATRERILVIAKRLGYTPNLAARMLSVGRVTVKIGVCIPQHDFYDQVRNGILDESRRFECLGVEVVYRPIAKLGAGEYESLKEMLETDATAVILTPGDPCRIRPLIDEAEGKNIRVVCVASDASRSSRSSVVCVNPDLGGRLAAELMARFVAPRAKTAVITGMLCTEDHRKKTEGFCAMFSQYCEAGEVVEVIEGHDNAEETFQKCLDFLGRCPDITGLYVNIGLSMPVCYALRARGLAGKVRLIGTDLYEEMVPFFEKQAIDASIYQRPYVQGQTAVRLIIEHALHGRPIPSTYYLSPAIVMRANLYEFRETRHLKPPPRLYPESNKEKSSGRTTTGIEELVKA